MLDLDMQKNPSNYDSRNIKVKHVKVKNEKARAKTRLLG